MADIKKYFKLGPATLIAAAFIGPGTVTVCTLAGANHGYQLLWALLFSIFATIILQEMAARLGLMSKRGLGEALRNELNHPVIKIVSLILVLSAIVIGNAAYEAGNISGAVLGSSLLLSESMTSLFPIIIGVIAFVLLFIGSYKVLERFLVTLVVLMSLCFITTAILTQPPLDEILKGMFIPRLNSDNLLLAIGLIGTTVVPYNLFLHASIINEKWSEASLSEVRRDTVVSIVLGGIVSMCILICAAAASSEGIKNVADLSTGLKPLLGNKAELAIGIGMFAAGITSAITAPLAAAYASAGILGWKKDLKSWKFRLVWIFILLIGVVFSSLGIKPIEVIKFAQVANGVLLPLIAGFLLWIVNKKVLMKGYQNTLWQNVIGAIVIAITLVLSGKVLMSVF